MFDLQKMRIWCWIFFFGLFCQAHSTEARCVSSVAIEQTKSLTWLFPNHHWTTTALNRSHYAKMLASRISHICTPIGSKEFEFGFIGLFPLPMSNVDVLMYLFCMRSNSFMVAFLPKRLTSLRIRFTVDTWTGIGNLSLISEVISDAVR
jgi:hypothetical protein